MEPTAITLHAAELAGRCKHVIQAWLLSHGRLQQAADAIGLKLFPHLGQLQLAGAAQVLGICGRHSSTVNR